MWLMGVVGAAAGLILLVYVPSLSAVSKSLLLFAGFHVVGGIVLLSSLYVSILRGVLDRWTGAAKRRATSETLDFGWGPGWMNGLAIAALVAVAGAVALEVAMPGAWPLGFGLISAAVVFVVGNTVMRGFRNLDHAVLPMVDLFAGDSDLILDAGCGSGRTTIAASRLLKSGRIVALDRFDAGYIDDGGRQLLDRNLKIAGLADKVDVQTGDLTMTPFPNDHFDSAVSTNVFDHLGSQKPKALGELFRVLKPGGRFLVGVWVPGWAMFTVGNVFSLFLTGKLAWRRLAGAAGFEVLDEGVCNNTWFLLLSKPRV